MAETKKVFKQAAMKEEGVVITGIVKFSNLREPGKFGSYDITLTMAEDDPQVAMIESLTTKAIEMEKALVPKAKQRDIQGASAPIKTDVDKEDNATGLLRVQLKKLGVTKSGKVMSPPEVLNNKNNPVDVPFIRAGSKVSVQVRAESYNAANKVGLTLKMERVKILEEAARTEGGGGEFVSKSVFGAPEDEEDGEDSIL